MNSASIYLKEPLFSHSNKHTSLEKNICPKPHQPSTMVRKSRKRKHRSSRAEESGEIDRSSRRDGVVRRQQEFDRSTSSRGSRGVWFDNRSSRAREEESDRLDRFSRSDGFIGRQEVDHSRSPVGRRQEVDQSRSPVGRQEVDQSRSPVGRQEVDQSRSPRGVWFDNRSSRAREEESDRLDRFSISDGFVGRQEVDQSRSPRGVLFDHRSSRAREEESGRLDRFSRSDGFVGRQEVYQSRSPRGDGLENRSSRARAEDSDWLDRSFRRDGVVRRGQKFDQSRSSRVDEVDNGLSRKVLGALAELVLSAATATAAAPAPSPTRLEVGSDVTVINNVANCYDDELDFRDAFDESDWSAEVTSPFPARSEFGSDPATVTRQIGTINNLAIDVARFVSPLCCVLHEVISEANPWNIYRQMFLLEYGQLPPIILNSRRTSLRMMVPRSSSKSMF
jgi:hypothetical protein